MKLFLGPLADCCRLVEPAGESPNTDAEELRNSGDKVFAVAGGWYESDWLARSS